MPTVLRLIILSMLATTFVAAAPTSKPANRSAPSRSVAPSPAAPPDAKQPKPKYQPSTPEADAAAIEHARNSSRNVQRELSLKFDEIQTPHFIVFTDWDPREVGFLKTNLEAAYAAVSRQFDIPVKENVFVGKLPVFMFARQRDFLRYAEKFDEIPPNEQLQGYYGGNGRGTGHMAMWKPAFAGGTAQRATAERRWAYTLTHEFTHAFVDRYRNSRPIPRWLNEGVAEVIAQSQFPQPDRRVMARNMAADRREFTDYEFLFDDEQMPGGEWYPVMQTMVETLITKDRQNFLQLFDAIKDNEKPEKAMKRIYGWEYPDLVREWRLYVMR
jgi:hypothetical protein